MPVVRTCPHCGKSFGSIAVQMDEGSFRAAQLTNITEPCPHCGKAVRSDKEDFRWEE